MREGAKLRTVAATSELVQRLNGIEHNLGEGPCVQADLEHRVYRIDDMALETRWPRFAAAAAGTGVQSMLGYRLFITGRTLGALDLYSSKPNAFDTDAELIGRAVRRACRSRDDRVYSASRMEGRARLATSSAWPRDPDAA